MGHGHQTYRVRWGNDTHLTRPTRLQASRMHFHPHPQHRLARKAWHIKVTEVVFCGLVQTVLADLDILGAFQPVQLRDNAIWNGNDQGGVIFFVFRPLLVTEGVLEEGRNTLVQGVSTNQFSKQGATRSPVLPFLTGLPTFLAVDQRALHPVDRPLFFDFDRCVIEGFPIAEDIMLTGRATELLGHLSIKWQRRVLRCQLPGHRVHQVLVGNASLRGGGATARFQMGRHFSYVFLE